MLIGLRVLSLLVLIIVTSLGCQTTTSNNGSIWPAVDTLPGDPPKDLDLSAPASVLRGGSDGYMYIVGGIPDTVRPGTLFFARYSGDWPLQDLPRPPLATGHVVKTFDKSALVSITYQLPKVELAGLEVTWESEPLREAVGKGVGYVSNVTQEAIEIGIGSENGVEVGDWYALLRRPEPDAAHDVQMARRLISVCLVKRVKDQAASCAPWQTSTILPSSGVPKAGDRAVFLEHSFGKLPPTGVIQIAAIQGDSGATARDALLTALTGFVASLKDPQASVELLQDSFDATRPDFYMIERKIVHASQPQMVVAGSIEDVKGVEHLIVNYTAIGSPSGPSFVAAPPERGVDLGPLDKLSPDKLVGFAAVVWGGMMVHRGQTAQALAHLKSVLAAPAVRGPLRWHTRDQFAMRWMVLDRLRQAKWMVDEDIAVARARGDQAAYLNAVGTVIHLQEMLKNPDAALKSAQAYYDARKGERPSSAYIAAHGMLIQMLLKNAKMDAAKRELKSLNEACPDGCDGQLSGVVGGLFWSVPQEQAEFLALILSRVVELASFDESSLPTARVLQGFAAMKASDFEQALIAFLEAGRLYEVEGNTAGWGRAKYLEMVAQIRRNEPEDALAAGLAALKIAESAQDFRDFSMIYEHMGQVFVTKDDMKMGGYLAAGPEVLAAGVQCKSAMGDESGVAEALYGLGAFLLQARQLSDAQVAFQRSVFSSIRSARFDVAALAHLSLAAVARQQNNIEVFRDELRRAKLMAEISGEPPVKEAIERALEPPEEVPNDPTQLL